MTEAIREGDIPGVQLRCRQALALPPEEAWLWLIEPARLARWLADEAEVEPGPRGSLRLIGDGSGSGEAGRAAAAVRERGTTVEYAPPRRWVLAFERLDAGWTAATRLALAIHPHAAGAELDVLQGGFQRLPLSLCLTVWEGYRARWRAALRRLAAATG
jgi:uncharacterized protein YndB with AHSA1/START domain